MSSLIAALALALASATVTTAQSDGAQTQEVRTALSPDTIRVGDRFYAAVRIQLPAGVTLAAPDTLPTSGDLENAGRVRRATRELPDGATEITLIYPLTPWRTGELEVPSATMRIVDPGGEGEELIATFPHILVVSVLPYDSAGVDPRPLKDVLGPSRLIWPWVVGALTIAAAVAAFVYYRRRSRERQPKLVFDVALAASPRDRALAALDAVRGLGLLEAGDVKNFYSRTIAALRAFLEECDPDWGTDLTSTELVGATRDLIPPEAVATLAQILDDADQVKFNRRTPPAPQALEEWAAVRRWIEEFELLHPVNAEEPAPAAAEEGEVTP